MTTALAATDPTNTTIHGPEGQYTVVFRGHRQPDAVRGLSTKTPRPYGPDHYSAGFSITEGYTVANNDTFRRIMDCLGWEITEVVGMLLPDRTTTWLGTPVTP